MTALITGNLLTVEQQSHDTVAAWSAKSSLLADGVTTAANTTLSRDTAVFNDSPASIKLVAVAAGSVSATTGWKKVTSVPAGAKLLFRTRRRRAALGQNMSVLINWVDSAGTLISQTNLGPGSSTLTTTDTVDTFVEVTSIEVTSPVGTATAEIVLTFGSLAAAEAVYFDTSYFGASSANQAPTADAGANQAVTVGAVVNLSGSGTDPEGTALTYSWATLTRPTGSTAVLSSTTTAATSFTADVAGDYGTALTVTDAGGLSSAADPVTVSASAVTLAAPRIGGTAATLKAGAARVTRIYAGSTLVFSDNNAVSQAVVQHSQIGTGDYQWEFSGVDWKSSAIDSYTATTGATATLRLTGTRFVLFGTRAADAGFMSVTVDGTLATTLDLYSATRQENQQLYVGTFADGAHTVVLTCVGDRNTSSSGFFVNIDRAAVDVVGPPPVVGGGGGGGTGTRNASINLHPYRGSWTSGAADGTWSVWNTPIGSGATLVSAGLKKSTDNAGKIYQDPIHVGYPGDPIKTFSAKVTDPNTGAYYEKREPWKSGGTAQVRVTAGDTGPGAYKGGNHIAWFPLSTDDTRGWHGHPLGLVDGGDPTVRYVDPHDAPDDLYGQGHYGAHGGSHMSGLGCIRQWEWDSPDEDVIQHAIGLNTWGELYLHWDSLGRKGKRWPANSTDSYASSGYKGTNPSMVMGTLLTVPANYNWSAITNLQARKIVRALWAFGFYIVDDAKWDVHQLSAERTIDLKAQDFAAFHTPIQDALVAAVIVDNNSPTSVGGGGTPRVARVPDVVRP